MERWNSPRQMITGGVSEEVLRLVLQYIDDPCDRHAISLVCRCWYQIDSLTRRHVTIAFCYSTTPQHLRRRFGDIQSLKLKGKPRAAMFNLIQEDWGGFATPWIKEIAESFNCLKSIHFRRMIVSDSDLELLAQSRGRVLEELKLDRCSGFSTDGLGHIARLCRNLRVLFLEESSISRKDGEWLHELALNNHVLESLNFYMTDLVEVRYQDLELIAKSCRSLVSLKISDTEISDLTTFFKNAPLLEEFGGGSCNEEAIRYSGITFPPKLSQVSLTYMGNDEMHMVFPFTSILTKLDLLYVYLDTECHCLLIQKCPNLEVLETRNVIGDRGLELVAQRCKKLKRLRVERGADEHEMEDVEGVVSHRGLIALAQGCLELEYLAIYVSDITNSALECVGMYMKNLSDFRIVLLDVQEVIPDLPLDNGVLSLLKGCKNLRRLALYLRPGGLTDVGLGNVGRYSQKVTWMLLGYVGESDAGLLEFSKGCPNLRRLEIRGSYFSEYALSAAVLRMPRLNYLWVQGYRESESGSDLLAMARPYWVIELISPRQEMVYDEGETVVVNQPRNIVAYHSLAEPRTDYPETVVVLDKSLLSF